ncbi:hypothetical protein [Streptomyces sp. TLI_105]|uniref:hypothetical protein n=1 Tax=Streptomyces sp. TLI_105 TaxID=1881019 RepID=UPI0015A54E62|nr:hypothetical protein [Streptomyces sp. TLI_105]
MEIFHCIAAVARPIHDFGDEFMSDQATAAIGLRAGFPPGARLLLPRSVRGAR